MTARFNPLHCGAVVASVGKTINFALVYGMVSIPFIAGQWSLLCGQRRSRSEGRVFQSPSLRGSGRFTASMGSVSGGTTSFQSPSLRGSGRFMAGVERRRTGRHVSIPFIAGQWSLLRRIITSPHPRRTGFNPLHCGAVVASSICRASRRASKARFNPLHCGAVVASRRCADRRGRRRPVSIPFIAGQWSLRRTGCGGAARPPPRFNPLHCGAVVASLARKSARGRKSKRFNPLHCGAVVASGQRRGGALAIMMVSIPFIAGQWSLPGPPRFRGGALCKFQSPSLRGSGRFLVIMEAGSTGQSGFNPLHCGAVVASLFWV